MGAGYFTIGLLLGLAAWFVLRYGVAGLYTVDQNERAVLTSWGRARRIPGATILDSHIAANLRPEERERYAWPRVVVKGAGGPYWKWPWERVYKVSVATQTMNMAYDIETPSANRKGTVLEAVTKDQLNVGLKGQIRYRVSEHNLYAYLFGVKQPIVHVMAYFVSILRERVACFEAPGGANLKPDALQDPSGAAGVSINDLRKNLRDMNDFMDNECESSAARYGLVLDASLITEIDPPAEVESALAAINTAHNQVSSEISLAQATADQKIVQSRRAVEIETLRAEAEVEPLVAMADQLRALKAHGPGVLAAYLRNVRLALLTKAKAAFVEDAR